MTPQERRAQIVDIAAEHFRRDGARSASVTAIAREAGVTRSLVYHYFPGQDALLEAAAERDVALLSAATRDDERLGPRLNAVRALEVFVQHFVDASADARALYVPGGGAAQAHHGETDDGERVVSRVGASARGHQVDQLLTVTGAADTAENRVALDAWLAFVAAAAHALALDPSLDRGRVIDACVRALEGVLGHPLAQDSGPG